MADECDNSGCISEMIHQDGVLLRAPVVKESEELDIRNDSSSNGVDKPNKNVDYEIGDDYVKNETDEDISSYSNVHKSSNAIHIDGNSPLTGAKKKRTENQKEKEVEILYNKKALTRLASTYKLEMFEKNLLIIYNFINVMEYKERTGTIQDADELENTFKLYGFEVEREGNEDLTRDELLRKLDEFDNRDFTEYGCVAIAVMTHGTWVGRLAAKDKYFNENEIINKLKTRTKPTLVTKPIVLIIQACRGTNSTAGIKVFHNKDRIERDHKEDLIYHYYLPLEADMIVIHSSYIGKPAFRPNDGTWFIQTLCQKIRELAATEDLESIMIEVKREVAIYREYVVRKSRVTSQSEEIEFHKQVPTVTSNLIRKLYLFKKIDVPLQSIPNGNVIIKDVSPVHDNSHGTKIHSNESDECACLLDILDYFKSLLRIYAAENVYDTQARCLLQQATLGTHRDLNFVRMMVIAISSFLKTKYQRTMQTKFIYWYGDDSYSTLPPPESQDISLDSEELKEVTSTSVGAPVIGAQTFFVAIKKFKMTYAPSILVGIGAYAAIHVAHNFVKNLRGN